MAQKSKFIEKLKTALKKIEGKKVNLGHGASNCIRIVLSGGKEYWCTVKNVDDDHFTIEVSYGGGGRENIVVKMSEVASFSEE